MPEEIMWKRSERGGWFFIDENRNYWYKSSNEEIITVETPVGRKGTGWTPEVAWDRLQCDE